MNRTYLRTYYADVHLFTNYLDELYENQSILQIPPEVSDGLQARFLLELSVHPGDVGGQLLLDSTGKKTKTNTNQKKHAHITV